MTGRASLKRLDLPIPDHFGAMQLLQPGGLVRVITPFPVEVRDLFRRPDFGCRITMAIETKSHAEWLIMINLFHLVDWTMALNATDTAIDMDRMIEINKVGDPMNLYPGNG